MRNGQQRQNQTSEQNLEKFTETQTTKTSEERITTTHILTAADTCGSLMWLQVEHATGTFYCTWDHSHTHWATKKYISITCAKNPASDTECKISFAVMGSQKAMWWTCYKILNRIWTTLTTNECQEKGTGESAQAGMQLPWAGCMWTIQVLLPCHRTQTTSSPGYWQQGRGPKPYEHLWVLSS